MSIPPLAAALLRDNLLKQEDLKIIASRMRETRGSFADTLADMKMPDEETIGSYLEDKHGHPYVSIQNSSGVKVTEKLIKLIPAQLAAKYKTIPLEVDSTMATVKALMIEPDSSEAISYLSMAANMPRVNAMQVLPSVFDVFYRRYYEGTIDAFVSNFGMTGDDVLWFLNKYAAMHLITLVDAQAELAWLSETGGESVQISSREREFSGNILVRSPGRPPSSHHRAPPPIHPHGTAGSVGDQEVFVVEQPKQMRTEPEAPTPPPIPSNLWTIPTMVGFLRNFMTVIDEAHPLGSGHSIRVTDRSLALAKRMGLGPDMQQKIAFTGLLHDVGMGKEHYTLISCFERTETRKKALLNYRFLQDTFEEMPIPEDISNILLSRFENYDGSGFPKGLKEDKIPLPCRILAVIDAFTDLRENKKYPSNQAAEVLQNYAGKLFDPVVTAALSAAVNSSVGAFAQVALVLTTDPILCSELEVLSQLNLMVLPADSDAMARKRMANAIVRVLLIDLDDNYEEGLISAEDLMHRQSCEGASLVFLASQMTPELKNNIQKLPVAGVIKKPINPEDIVDKIKDLLERGITTGSIKRNKLLEQSRSEEIDTVSSEKDSEPAASAAAPASSPSEEDSVYNGSFDQYPFSKLLRKYFSLKLTGRLTLLEDNITGEIYFDQGRIVHAIQGENVGERAFATLAKLPSASYWFDLDTLVLDAGINRPMHQLIAYVDKVTGYSK